ncbi:MAG: cysteine-rich repeat protein [Bradymonadia bacterium]
MVLCDDLNAVSCYCASDNCGDGNLEFGENCDDGNRANNDGCDSSCQVEGAPDDDSVCGDDFLMPVVGFVFFNSCNSDNDNDNVVTSECASGNDSNDVVLEFILLDDSAVTIRAFDWDSSVPVNPRIYLRQDTCEEDAPQIACQEDVPCGDEIYGTGTCVGGVQPREALIEIDLDAGVHHLVVDTRTNGSFVCGFVGLLIESEPL